MKAGNKSIKVAALSRAKVNLHLQVLGKRSDGYHFLDSLVAFPNIGDEIFIELAEEITLDIGGTFGSKLSIEKNLILNAAKILHQGSMGALITLNKELPISSGLGGGSSNAAVVLKMLSKLWDQPLPSLTQLVSLGADVPVCLNWDLQKMKGIGEKLEKVDEPPMMWIVLVNRGEKISTRSVFESLKSFSIENPGSSPAFKTRGLFLEYLISRGNDLEIPVVEKFPQIQNLLDTIKKTNGCSISRMSGSGATCFGIFLKKDDAYVASKELSKSFPNAWIRVGELFS